MTLIAFATYGKHAELVTDTPSYGPSLRTMGHSTKFLPLPHLDAVVATQGDCVFGYMAKLDALNLADSAPDADALLQDYPEVLREAWQTAIKRNPHASGAAFLIGWSPQRERFAAHLFDCARDFEPQEIRGAFIHPSPTSFRPSEMELRVMVNTGVHPQNMQVLRARPKLPKPASREEWLELATTARQERSMAPVSSGLKCLVGGKVFHTRIGRGEVHTDLLHTFEDSGEEWRKIIEGTMHPQAQLGPCPCGSGERMVDCHMPMDDPCYCQSGKTVGDCCAITANEREAATA